MKLDKELIQKVANNAKLKLTESEIKEFLPQLKEILEAFSTLDKVKIEKNTESSIQPVELKNALREDKETDSLTTEEALKNTKNKKDNYFKGPKAI